MTLSRENQKCNNSNYFAGFRGHFCSSMCVQTSTLISLTLLSGGEAVKRPTSWLTGRRCCSFSRTLTWPENVRMHEFVCGSVQAALFIKRVLSLYLIFIEGFRFFCSLNVIISNKCDPWPDRKLIKDTQRRKWEGGCFFLILSLIWTWSEEKEKAQTQRNWHFWQHFIWSWACFFQT